MSRITMKPSDIPPWQVECPICNEMLEDKTQVSIKNREIILMTKVCQNCKIAFYPKPLRLEMK